jgi:hypothetical protein
MVSGRIMRTSGTCAAIQMTQHEFRTIAQPAEQRPAASVRAHRTPPTLMAGAGSRFSFGKFQ